MLRASLKRLAGPYTGKEMLFGLWNKPETRDSRVKEYVPEVIEESLAEQRAVLEESTSRDIIVELGHKVLRLVENKAPTPSIAPSVSKMLGEFGAPELISQRSLSYLLYPSSSVAQQQQPAELISTFADNLKSFIEHIEENGSSIHVRQEAAKANVAEPEKQLAANPAESSTDETDSNTAATSAVVPPQATAATASAPGTFALNALPPHAEDPVDVALLSKLTAGMALANIQCSDNQNALKCVDFALRHSSDSTRRGALNGMKAGILNRLKRYDAAAEAAQLAIEGADNVQGYLQGATAYRLLKKDKELVQLLDRGASAHPNNTVLLEQRDNAKKQSKFALEE